MKDSTPPQSSPYKREEEDCIQKEEPGFPIKDVGNDAVGDERLYREYENLLAMRMIAMLRKLKMANERQSVIPDIRNRGSRFQFLFVDQEQIKSNP